MLPDQALNFVPSAAVSKRIRAMGRTEDVVFSPDQTRLAIAGYTEHKVLVLEIKVISDNGVLSVQSDRCVELHSPDFKLPHGLSWIDDNTLAVANRGKDVVVVSVPATSAKGEAIEVEPHLRLSETGDDLIHSPGSVTVINLNSQWLDIIVCNNYWHYVSRHIVERKNGFKVLSGHRLFDQGLKIPDGVAASQSGEFLAVSNHEGRRIDVFQNDAESGRHSVPVFSLDIPGCPHGVRFAMNDRLLVVADAGAPYVHVFARDGGAWKDGKAPVSSIKVMDDGSFQRGHTNPVEGGPKGVDVLADGSLLVVSCHEVPIAFFDFRSVRDQLVPRNPAKQEPQRSSDARLLETAMAAMRGQHAQIVEMQAELEKLRPKPRLTIDKWLRRTLKQAAQKVLSSAGKH